MKTVHNQAFWREILDEVSSLVFVFRIEPEAGARLIYTNEVIRTELGYDPIQFVLASEEEGPVSTMLNGFLNELADKSHLDRSAHRGVHGLSTATGGRVELPYRFRIFQPSAGLTPLMVVTFGQSGSQPAVRRVEGGLIAESDRMKELVGRLAQFAKHRRSLWIQGEPGTGRRTLAAYYTGLLGDAPVRLVDRLHELKPKDLVGGVVVVVVAEGSAEAWMANRRDREAWVYAMDFQPVMVAPWRYRLEDARALVADTLDRLSEWMPVDEPTRHRLTAMRIPDPVPGGIRNWVMRELVGAGTATAVAPTETGTWEEMSAAYLKSVLQACGGKIYGKDGAAVKLGLKPTTLQSKLKKLNVR